MRPTPPSQLAALPRILCCIHAPGLGGVERVALRLCRAWAELGADVSIAVGRTDGQSIQAGEARLLIAPRTLFSTAPVETLWMIVWLALCIRRTRPDVIFCPGNSYTVVMVVMRLLFGARCPPIVAKISNDLQCSTLPAVLQPVIHAWIRLQGRIIDRFVALSPAMRDSSAGLLGVPRSRIGLAVNPVLEDRALARLAVAGDTARRSRGVGRRFVCAGRLAPQKCHRLLIEAFALGAGAEDRLLIVGDGPLRTALQEEIDRRGLKGRVVLAGARERPEQWLSECDILLLSSAYEGLPAVVVEAMAAGITVVATDCCASMRGLLEDGALGTIVPSGDVSAFARAIAGARPTVNGEAMAAKAAMFTIGEAAMPFLHLLQRSSARTAPFTAGIPLQEHHA